MHAPDLFRTGNGGVIHPPVEQLLPVVELQVGGFFAPGLGWQQARGDRMARDFVVQLAKRPAPVAHDGPLDPAKAAVILFRQLRQRNESVLISHVASFPWQHKWMETSCKLAPSWA
jgi:hypothetical protein